MEKTKWFGLWQKRPGVYSGYQIKASDMREAFKKRKGSVWLILKYNKYYRPDGTAPRFVWSFADNETKDSISEDLTFEEYKNQMDSLSEVGLIEAGVAKDDIRVAVGDIIYGCSSDDVIADAWSAVNCQCLSGDDLRELLKKGE